MGTRELRAEKMASEFPYVPSFPEFWELKI